MQNSVDRFFDTVQAYDDKMNRISGTPNRGEQELKDMKQALLERLRKGADLDAVNKSHPLRKDMEKLTRIVEEKVRAWSDREHGYQAMRKLSDRFGDRLLFFISGKVNAGKSSFCNFLIRQARERGIQPRFFSVSGRDIQYLDMEEFEIGATETTSTIQGVELGRLVLVDTPGLYSMTEKHGELTKEFLDAGDALIWLTSSSSPGQVQELTDLSAEIRLKKPILPVITRSDRKDWLQDGRLDMKPARDRSAQQADVHTRAAAKVRDLGGNPDLLRRPVSVSVRYAETYSDAEDWLTRSGLDDFFSELDTITVQAAENKVDKKLRQAFAFFEKTVLHSVKESLVPTAVDIHKLYQEECRKLRAGIRPLAAEIMNQVMPTLDTAIHRHAADRDTKALAREVSEIVSSTIDKAVRNALESMFQNIAVACINITPDQLGRYQDMTAKIKQIRGMEKQEASAAAGAFGGAAAGAAAGNTLGGPVGMFIGGAVGAYVGHKAGSHIGEKIFVEEYTITEIVGTSEAEIRKNLIDRLAPRIEDSVTRCIENIIESLRPLERYLADFRQEAENMQARLETVRQDFLSQKPGGNRQYTPEQDITPGAHVHAHVHANNKTTA